LLIIFKGKYIHKVVLRLASVFEKELRLFEEKMLTFTSQTSVTDLQAPGEASSPRKRAFSTSKIISSLFSFFVGHFCLPGSGSTDSVKSGSSFSKLKHLLTYVECSPMLDYVYYM
jgi:hypothetical protein